MNLLPFTFPHMATVQNQKGTAGILPSDELEVVEWQRDPPTILGDIAKNEYLYQSMKLTPSHIQTARRHLRAADPVMRSMIDAVGPYTLRFERDRFGMLVRSIVSQQISTTAVRWMNVRS